MYAQFFFVQAARLYNRTVRLRCLATIAAFCWTFIGFPLAAMAQQISQPISHHYIHETGLSVKPVHPKQFSTFMHASGTAKSAPFFINDPHATRKTKEKVNVSQYTSPTLLDEVGHIERSIPDRLAMSWSHNLQTPDVSRANAALLNLWLGEWQLAANEQPVSGAAHFATSASLTSTSDPMHGLALYDTAIAHFNEGAYREAKRDFYGLLTHRPALTGFDRSNCALWHKHMCACSGYHEQRSRMGIPEPTRTDPRCGAAGLAACMRALGRLKLLLSNCRVTGKGSSIVDLENAGRKLGLSTNLVRSDDQGLIALPKPLVAFVEHDPFIAVTGANKQGVTYLCSDCGPGRAEKYALIGSNGTHWKRSDI